jgi:S-adenosyl methyltransferase
MALMTKDDVPGEIDTTTPSPARMYDYYLGGKDNFAADRDAARKALSVVPQGRQVAWANRRFLIRAVRYLARSGITQFIDLGTGIPTSPNVHEAARSINPDSRVVYVDNDPMVTVHSRAILAGFDDGIEARYGDIRYPRNIAFDTKIREVIDFSRPIGVLFIAVLHFVTDAEEPHKSVAVLRDCIASGSYIAISHITSEGTPPEVMTTIQDAYSQARAPAVFRDRPQIDAFFTGLELVKPGLVEVSAWRGNNRKPATPHALRFLGGIGRKPA